MAYNSFSINDIINKQASGIPVENPMVEDTNVIKNNTQVENTPVRYEGGETVKDKDGNEYVETPSTSKRIGEFLFGNGDARTLVENPPVPLKAKKGEPEFGWEWAEDAAQKIWDTGKSMDEVKKDMSKKYKLADRIINDNKNVAESAGNPDSPDYDKPVQYYKKTQSRDGLIYKTPEEQTEDLLADRYGFYKDDSDVFTGNIKPSIAIGLINKAGLKQEWKDFIENPTSEKADSIKEKLNNLRGIKSEKELKKLGFRTQSDYDAALGYTQKSLNWYVSSRVKGSNTGAENAQDKIVPEVKEEPVETTGAENAQVEETNTNTEEKTPETPTETTEPETDDGSFEKVMAGLEREDTVQEIKARKEAEEIAEKELTRKEAEKLEKDIEDAIRKEQQGQYEYEEWLKNPTLISGIFGKSGLSMARRWGLGLSALFAIFSDAAANYAKGIRGNTDFKNTAMEALNSTIKTIQDKRAETIGDNLASRPYKTATDAEEAINKEYEKLKRLSVSTYIPSDTLKAFIQESQIDTKEPLSEGLYDRFTNEARDGYISFISKNDKLKKAYLNEDGTLNAAGEYNFLKKQDYAISMYKNALGLSDERLANINARLELDKKKAEVRSAVHDVMFRTNTDYINAINAMEEENRVLETSKLEFTEAATLDAMLELAKKNRSIIAGLSTSSNKTEEGTSEEEASLNRYVNQGGLETTNEELTKRGWQAELNGEAGAKFPIKLVPISATINAGGKWSKEQAEKYVESEYNKWTRDDQSSSKKARSLSNASGRNIDDYADEVLNFINTEKSKGAAADFNKARQNVLDAIDRKIEYNNQVIDELKARKEAEGKFDTGLDSSASTTNPYVSVYNDVPTKDANWYKHRLALS